jgi:hypothetical protein
MQNFKMIAYLLLGYFWLVGEELGKIKGFLSPFATVDLISKFYLCITIYLFDLLNDTNHYRL